MTREQKGNFKTGGDSALRLDNAAFTIHSLVHGHVLANFSPKYTEGFRSSMSLLTGPSGPDTNEPLLEEGKLRGDSKMGIKMEGKISSP